MMSMIHVAGGQGTAGRNAPHHLYHVESKAALANEDENDAKAKDFRVDIIRLTLALAVMLHTYTRIGFDGYCMGSIDGSTKWLVDWDRLRLRQLLTDEEFRLADECLGFEGGTDNSAEALAAQFRKAPRSGPPRGWPDEFEVSLQPKARAHLSVMYRLREVLLRATRDPVEVQWGIKDRFIPTLSSMLSVAQDQFEMISQIITTPLPLPYASLCKTLLMIWMAMFPMVVNYQIGIFGGLATPILIVFALLGIDAVCTELENPFGEDANDLDLIRGISELEAEAAEFLELCGDHRARAQFVWRRVPDCVASVSAFQRRPQLALASQAIPEMAAPSGGTPASSHRSGRSGGSIIRSGSVSEASGR